MVWATHMRKGKETQVLNIKWLSFDVYLNVALYDLRSVQQRKWSPTANVRQTGNDPEPKVIPDVDRKWSRRKTRNGIEFGFLDFFMFYFTFIYLLLTEFEGRTVSYGPSFFLFDLWPKREARGP